MKCCFSFFQIEIYKVLPQKYKLHGSLCPLSPLLCSDSACCGKIKKIQKIGKPEERVVCVLCGVSLCVYCVQLLYCSVPGVVYSSVYCSV